MNRRRNPWAFRSPLSEQATTRYTFYLPVSRHDSQSSGGLAMALTLKYQGETSVPVEIEGLIPDKTKLSTLAELEKFPIYHGNREIELAEFFSLSGDPSDGNMIFQGDLSGVHWIGAGMSEGEIVVEGNAGRHVGSEMTGGSVLVQGDAGDWVGGEMHGGFLHVKGRAGHLIGAAYRGSRRGMTGGTLLVDGKAGNEVGHTMRRGLIAVGSAGDAVAFNMIAGSVFVFGDCGIRPAAGMRRGCVALFGDDPPALLPTFRRDCVYQPQFLRYYLLKL
ncbi:MAG: formylmethanofuran dehydrogenase subunit C, partial [Planctomycetales bacterium]